MHYSIDESRQYHIQAAAGEIGRYVILPGDPKRCVKIAQYLENPVLIADSREFVTYTGRLDGVKVSVTSTGIGGPSASIAMEELIQCGADTFVRIGTCGGMQPQVRSGDIVIATGAVRMEGTSREYAPIEYPAVADMDVVNALTASARSLGLRKAGRSVRAEEGGRSGSADMGDYQKAGTPLWPETEDGKTDCGAPSDTAAKSDRASEDDRVFHVGVVQCKDSFYGQHDPQKMPVSYELENKWEAWKRLGCLASEMESAAMFIVAASRGIRCGSCCLVMANQEREKLGLPNPVVHDTDLAVRVAVGSVRELIHID